MSEISEINMPLLFFRIFRTLPGHVLQLAYLFRIFRTFSSSFICAHAPEVPHFFKTFARAPGMFFFRIFRTLRGHVLQLAYLFRIFQIFSSSSIFAHAPEGPHFFMAFAQAPGMFFFRIFRTLPRHVLQVAYLFRILRTFSSSFISAHAPEVPHFFTTLSEINVPNVIHVLRVSGIFGKKTSLVLGQVS